MSHHDPPTNRPSEEEGDDQRNPAITLGETEDQTNLPKAPTKCHHLMSHDNGCSPYEVRSAR